MQNNRKGRFPMKKHHVILLLLAFLLLLTGCGAGSAAEHAASTPAADARILTALAPGIVVRRVELSDGLLVFGDLVTEFGCSQPPSRSENTRCTITYAETTALLGIDLAAVLQAAGLPAGLTPTQEDFLTEGWRVGEGAQDYGTCGKNTAGSFFEGVGFDLEYSSEYDMFFCGVSLRATTEGEFLDALNAPGIYSSRVQYESNVGDVPLSINERYWEPSLGPSYHEYFATFSVSGLRYTIQACGCCTQEEFIRLVLAVMDAYGE